MRVRVVARGAILHTIPTSSIHYSMHPGCYCWKHYQLKASYLLSPKSTAYDYNNYNAAAVAGVAKCTHVGLPTATIPSSTGEISPDCLSMAKETTVCES